MVVKGLSGLIGMLLKSDDAMDKADANDIAYFALTGNKVSLRKLDTLVRDMVFDELVREQGVEYAEEVTGFTANTY